MNKAKKGFTLIELLIVIVIIGILAAITITVTAGLTDRANDTEGKSTVSVIAKAAEAYYVDNQAYPADWAALSSLEPSYMKTGTIGDLTQGTTEGTYEYTLTSGCFEVGYVLANADDPQDAEDDGGDDGVYSVTCSQ